MGWRERFGADDERAQIAARARALLDAAGSRPSSGAERPIVAVPIAAVPGAPSVGALSAAAPSGALSAGDASAPALPSPRGGWVPTPAALEIDAPVGADRVVADDGAEPGERRRSAGPSGAWWEREGSAPTPRAAWRERFRIDPGRRGLVAVAAVVVVVGSIAGGVLVRGGQSSAVTLAAASGAPPSVASAAPVAPSGVSDPPSPAGSASASPVGTVTVDVAGLVTRPGVYTLPAGSRVDDALAAAGGAKPGADLSTLNRARVLVDGEQLAVGVPGAVAPAPTAGGSDAGGSGPTGLVNLNTAALADLDTLPGVGPVLGQAILDWRTDHGRFSSVDDLQQVSGIGPSRFADLKDLVTV